MKARRFVVLDINDEEDEDFVASLRNPNEDLGHFFGGYQLTSWIEVQQDLANAEPMKPDLLLIDINFQKDSSTQYVDFRVAGGLRPFGLILALPYLNARAISGASLYTGNKPDSEALNSPWVLIPLGLIAASQRRTIVQSETFASAQGTPLEQDEATVEQFRGEVTSNRPTSRTEALREAMRFYHQSFGVAFDEQIIEVTNSVELRAKVDELYALLLDNPAETRPFPNDLYLEYYSASHGIERIFLHSFCADIFEFRNCEVSLDDCELIRDRLNEYFREDPLFELTWAVFEKFPFNDFDGRLRFDQAIVETHHGNLPKEDLRAIVSLAVLFANAEAWARSDPTQSDDTLPHGFQKRVFECLGTDNNTYLSWFGKRPVPKSKKRTPKKAKKGRSRQQQQGFGRTLRIPFLEQFESPSGKSPFLMRDAQLSGEELRRVRQYLGNLGLDEDWSRIPVLAG